MRKLPKFGLRTIKSYVKLLSNKHSIQSSNVEMLCNHHGILTKSHDFPDTILSCMVEKGGKWTLGYNPNASIKLIKWAMIQSVGWLRYSTNTDPLYIVKNLPIPIVNTPQLIFAVEFGIPDAQIHDLRSYDNTSIMDLSNVCCMPFETIIHKLMLNKYT